MSDVSTSTPASLTDRTPKIKLEKQLFVETKRRKELESTMSSNPVLAKDYSIMTCLKIVEKYCSSTVHLLIKSQIDNKNLQSKGYRYSNDMKQLAHSIFFISAKLYKNMQKPLYLPSCGMLKKVTIIYMK